MTNSPFKHWPLYSPEEILAVQDVLASGKVNYWTGTQCREFEKEFAAWTGSNYAVALANGTLALDVALKALGIGNGDEVIVTSRTFIASVSCIVNAGATPIFADVELDCGNISARTILKVITPRTKAIVCVHLAGWPCDMDPIMEIAHKRNIKVIEDCAQAHGARYKGRSVGSIGHIGAWSFCQDKIMTTGGEGGMVTTSDEGLWRKMWSHKDHGKSYEAVYEKIHPPGFRWLHNDFGTNWRMLEIQAALGRIQLRRMPEWTAKRNQNAEYIKASARKFDGFYVPESKYCSEINVNCCLPSNACVHAYYKCYIYIEPSRLNPGWTRDVIIDQLNLLGVPCFQGTCSEVYLEKAFDGTGYRPLERLPIAKKLGETSLMFLVHPTLSEQDIIKTCQSIEAVMKIASM